MSVAVLAWPSLPRMNTFKSASRLAILVALLSAPGYATTPPKPTVAGVVTTHGRLQVTGNRIVGKDGQPVSLAGNSFFWSQAESPDWTRAQSQYYNSSTVAWLVKDWKTAIVRVALGVTPAGYLEHPEADTARICTVIDAAIAADIYVIIDWHDHAAHHHTAAAVGFFQEMARRYGKFPHVIYEIYNEPMAVSWPQDVKPYATEVIAAIRAIDPDNLIVVGSPHWAQDVDVAAADPIKDVNVAYSLHFYAGTHKQELRDKAVKAMQLGAALFVTEWGTVNADGNGPIAETSLREWLAFLRQHQLSHCNWVISAKNETSSILQPAAAATGGWTDTDLTPSGRYVRQLIRAWNP